MLYVSLIKFKIFYIDKKVSRKCWPILVIVFDLNEGCWWFHGSNNVIMCDFYLSNFRFNIFFIVFFACFCRIFRVWKNVKLQFSHQNWCFPFTSKTLIFATKMKKIIFLVRKFKCFPCKLFSRFTVFEKNPKCRI